MSFHPSPGDPTTWPDACQIVTAAQLASVWQGAFTQVGTYGSLLSGGNTPHYATCKYTQQTAGGDLVIVSVNMAGVQPVDQAHPQFATAARTSLGTPETGIGDEAFYSSTYGEVEVRQGVTVWSVAVNQSDDSTARQPHAERLAKMIAPELA